jgi:hypothetical protein
MTEERSTIFVIDDDPSARKGLMRLVSAAGLNVETFGSARAELRIDFDLCNSFIREVHDFFDRLFESADLQPNPEPTRLKRIESTEDNK